MHRSAIRIVGLIHSVSNIAKQAAKKIDNMTNLEKGRVRFIKTTMRTSALKMFPWAQYTLKMDGGYYCFELLEDLTAYKEKHKWEYSNARSGGAI